MQAGRLKQRKTRDNLFLKGPVEFGWIRANIPDPASRLVLVAKAFMNMATPAKTSIELTAKLWDCAGIDGPDRRARVLGKIDKACSGFRIERRPGRTAVIHKLTE